MKDGMPSESALWGGTRYRPPPRSGRISQPDATSSRGNGHDRPHGQNLALPPLPQAFQNESKKLVASLRHEDPQEPVSAQGWPVDPDDPKENAHLLPPKGNPIAFPSGSWTSPSRAPPTGSTGPTPTRDRLRTKGGKPKAHVAPLRSDRSNRPEQLIDSLRNE